VSVKRVHYFTHQFLREQEFKDEQNYHIEMRRRHNRLLHSWGVADGLEVDHRGEREIIIKPGVAIDPQGREIVLLDPVTRDLSEFQRDSHTYITIGYAENWDEADHQHAGGAEGYSRVTEAPEICERRHQPEATAGTVTLAKVHINGAGHVGQIDMSPAIRRRAVAPSPAAGWVRLPFKPVRLNPVRIERRLVRVVSESEGGFEFIVDEASAYCDEKGARGSMGIPVPPAAVKVTGFRIAGSTEASVTVHLHRTGWNAEGHTNEKTEILREEIRDASFHKDIHVDSALDESHGLAVSVIADGKTTIWLVAARFE
jgi:hypothetical protein